MGIRQAMAVVACLILCGCERGYQAQPNSRVVEVQTTPAPNPPADRDINVKAPGVDVQIDRGSDQPSKVNVDVNP
jgi:hypothetical protein